MSTNEKILREALQKVADALQIAWDKRTLPADVISAELVREYKAALAATTQAQDEPAPNISPESTHPENVSKNGGNSYTSERAQTAAWFGNGPVAKGLAEISRVLGDEDHIGESTEKVSDHMEDVRAMVEPAKYTRVLQPHEKEDVSILVRGGKIISEDDLDKCDVCGQIFDCAECAENAALLQAPEPAQAQEPCGGREYCGRMPFCGCGAPPLFPERDPTKPAEEQG